MSTDEQNPILTVEESRRRAHPAAMNEWMGVVLLALPFLLIGAVVAIMIVAIGSAQQRGGTKP